MATATVVPLLLGSYYLIAEPRERRRMRLVLDGIGRFGRWAACGLMGVGQEGVLRGCPEEGVPLQGVVLRRGVVL